METERGQTRGSAAAATARDRLLEAVPSRRRLAIYALLLNLQVVGVVLYYALSTATPDRLRYVVYGLLWINVGALAIHGTRSPAGVDFRTRRRALALAAGYFGLLAVLGGLVGTGVPGEATGLRVAWITPGWGPALVYGGTSLTVVVMPAYVVGYTALAYLVYVTILDAAAGSAVGGLLGLLSCLSCTWPIIALVGSALFGGTGFLAATAMALSYDLSTVVFLATVALLYWRPGFG